MKAIRKILALIRKADKDFNLIQQNDKIVIGISGGKDSMALLYALNLYKRFSKNNFEIYPCMINLGFDNFNPSIIEEYVNKLGYKLEILNEPQVYEILKIQKDKQNLSHLPCSICSRMKKAIINKYANTINVTKVSFAHHKDDAIETLFLNEIYGGRIATFSPKMLLENENINFIRPFIYVSEQDIKKMISEEHIPTLGIVCPNDKHTERENIKNILLNIYEKYPEAKQNFLNMLKNKEKEDIFYLHEDHQIENTELAYHQVKEINDFIIYKEFNNEPITEIDKKSFKFLIYLNNKLIGTSSIIKLKEREYKLNSINIDEKYKQIFLDDLKKELFQRFNPYTFIE